MKKSSSAAPAPYHHGDLRSALIVEARRELEHAGVHDMSLRQLARAVGVSEAAPSRHFDGKNGLLAAIAASGFRDLTVLRQQALAGTEGNLARVYEMMRIYVKFAQDHKGLFDLMIGPRLVKKTDYAELADAANESFELFASAVRDYARDHDWMEQDMPLVTHAAWAVEHGLATLIIGDRLNSEDRPIDVEKMIHFSVTLLLSGIAAGPGPTSTIMSELTGSKRGKSRKRG
ncbi:MAG TPA: TetR/AcrR family transcriptional regulator [Bordetella sp.]|jgi:AcrR family transcriptional regulator|nr:TetR/AcrR family transcriptional regulator [Bordetella sp.]